MLAILVGHREVSVMANSLTASVDDSAGGVSRSLLNPVVSEGPSFMDKDIQSRPGHRPESFIIDGGCLAIPMTCGISSKAAVGPKGKPVTAI